MAFFDYKIPADIEVERGALVRVPFRNRVEHGIVSGVKEKSDQKGVKEIVEVLDSQFLSDTELKVYEDTAAEILQSVPAVLDAAFLPPRKRTSSIERPRQGSITNKIRQQEVDYIKQALELIGQDKPCFIETVDIVQATAMIEACLRQHASNKQNLILVSHVHDADMVAAALSKLDSTLTVLDSRSTKPQRADIAQAWRQGEIKTLVATRVGSILPAHDLGTIFVVRSGSDEHAQYDRNPRYDARNLVWHWHQVTGAQLIFFDVLPRVVDLSRFSNLKLATCNLQHDTKVINLKDQLPTNDTPILSEPLLEHISQALQNKQKVILSYNRKEANALLSGRGIGNVRVQNLLHQHFPAARIARIEKDGADTHKNINADIILATQFYFENILNPFTEQNVGLVAELMADLGMSEPYYTATESLMCRLLELRGLAWRMKSNFLVQTWSAKLIKQMLNDPHATLKAEDDVRKHFMYPPHGKMWRIFSRSDRRKPVSADTLTGVIPQMQNISPDIKVTTTEHTLEIRADLKYTKQINSLLKSLPDSYIIEIDPDRNRYL